MVKSLRELVQGDEELRTIGGKKVEASKLGQASFSIYYKNRNFDGELLKIAPLAADAYRKQLIGQNGNYLQYTIWFYKLTGEESLI